MAQDLHALFEILRGGPGGGEARGFVLALVDDGLLGEVDAFTAALRVRSFLLGKLDGLYTILNHFVFAGFDGSVGLVHGAVRVLYEDGVDAQTGAVGGDAGHDVADREAQAQKRYSERCYERLGEEAPWGGGVWR